MAAALAERRPFNTPAGMNGRQLLEEAIGRMELANRQRKAATRQQGKRQRAKMKKAGDNLQMATLLAALAEQVGPTRNYLHAVTQDGLKALEDDVHRKVKADPPGAAQDTTRRIQELRERWLRTAAT